MTTLQRTPWLFYGERPGQRLYDDSSAVVNENSCSVQSLGYL